MFRWDADARIFYRNMKSRLRAHGRDGPHHRLRGVLDPRFATRLTSTCVMPVFVNLERWKVSGQAE